MWTRRSWRAVLLGCGSAKSLVLLVARMRDRSGILFKIVAWSGGGGAGSLHGNGGSDDSRWRHSASNYWLVHLLHGLDLLDLLNLLDRNCNHSGGSGVRLLALWSITTSLALILALCSAMNNLIVDESLLFKVGVIAVFISMRSLGRISGISVGNILLWWCVAASDSLITLCVSLAEVGLLGGATCSFCVKRIRLSVLIQIEEFRMDQCHLVQS